MMQMADNDNDDVDFDGDRRSLESRDVTTFEIASFYAVQYKILQLKNDLFYGNNRLNVSNDPLSTQIQMPIAPAGANIDTNIKQARESFDPFWFIEMVRSNGPWDYKRIDMRYENFGNFNFGATALAFGFQEKFALQVAGLYNVLTNKAQPHWKEKEYQKAILDFAVSFEGPPYGDDPRDQAMIKYGFQYYKEIYANTYRGEQTTKESVVRLAASVFESRYPGATVMAKSILDILN